MIKVELFGTSMANNSVIDALQKKEVGIRVDFNANDQRTKVSLILNIEDARALQDGIESCLINAEKIGVKVV